jgi:UDP-glucose 4-epimerase
VFGGAGFIGSHIVEQLVAAGDRIIVVDGLVQGTGGSAAHLAAVRDRVDYRPVTIAELPDLAGLLRETDVVIDAMAWTTHIAALAQPLKDLQLNLVSHLTLLEGLRASPAPRVIYLGSRSQFGHVAGVLDNNTPMNPLDVQGIHKAAAEQHFRLWARRQRRDVLSLRLPNCFGERQPVSGDDIGLVGGFIRKALNNEVVEVFGEQRRRCLLYARDAADIVVAAAGASWSGFTGVNAGGTHVAILELAQQVVAAAGRGSVEVRPLPPDVKAIDAGDAEVDESALRTLVGKPPRHDFGAALRATVAYFKEHI